MKKSFAIVSIIVLIIGMLGVRTNAASATMSISPVTKTVIEGDTFSITVSVGAAASMLEFDLNYDSSILGKASKSSKKGEFDARTGTYGYVSTEDDLSSVTFTFTAQKTGTSRITLSAASLRRGGQKIKNADIVKGASTITVNSKPDTSSQIPSYENKDEENSNNSDNTNNSGNSNNSSNINNSENANSSGGTSNSNVSSSSNNSENSNIQGNSGAPENSNMQNNKKNDNKNEENAQQLAVVEQIPTEQPNNTVVTFAPNELIEMSNSNVKTLEDKENKLILKALPIAFEYNENVIDDVQLKVTAIRENVLDYRTIENILKDIPGNKRYFDIKLVKDNSTIQPNGYVTVCIEIPEGYNTEQLGLYYVDQQNSKYEKIDGKIQGNYYTFTTNHFSVYALTDGTMKEAETEETKTFMQKLIDNKVAICIIIGIVIIILIVIIVAIKRRF